MDKVKPSPDRNLLDARCEQNLVSMRSAVKKYPQDEDKHR